MNNLGRKIYYGKSNGIVIWDTGEMSGNVRRTTLEDDAKAMPILEYLGDEVGVIELPFGDFKDEFANCTDYKINPDKKIVDFLGVEISSEPITEVYLENTQVAVGNTIFIPVEYRNLSGVNTETNKTVQVLINGNLAGDLNIINGVAQIEFLADEVGKFTIQIENKTCEVTVYG